MEVVNGLSFDVEDWFHVENMKGTISPEDWDSCDLRVVESTRRILRLLDEKRIRATFFVLGWVAERCPSLVEEIHGEGHEIASHGYGHDLVYRHTVESFEGDVRRSIDILRGITGEEVMGYRAPSFSITPRSEWAVDVLGDLGFRYDSSIFPTSFHNRYGFNGVSRFPFRFANGLIEMPLSTYRLPWANLPLAGGGYFRLYPYPFFRHLCRCLNRQGKAIVFYLPPWELDPGQPKMDIGLNHRFRHYVNLNGTEERVRRFLGEFEFSPLGELVQTMFPGCEDQASARYEGSV
jgi:polysaccharide deacetylase family protein (PEP-CTERM system associated)